MFAAVCLGHFVADYLFQTKKVALTKSTKGKSGWYWCTVHCIIYTATIIMFTGYSKFSFLILVFVSHFFIDRWSLANKWLELIGGRTLRSAMNSTDQYRDFDIAFTAVVYTIADNTMHLLLLWLISRLY